jgi:hypothetical protein
MLGCRFWNKPNVLAIFARKKYLDRRSKFTRRVGLQEPNSFPGGKGNRIKWVGRGTERREGQLKNGKGNPRVQTGYFFVGGVVRSVTSAAMAAKRS